MRIFLCYYCENRSEKTHKNTAMIRSRVTVTKSTELSP